MHIQNTIEVLSKNLVKKLQYHYLGMQFSKIDSEKLIRKVNNVKILV